MDCCCWRHTDPTMAARSCWWCWRTPMLRFWNSGGWLRQRAAGRGDRPPQLRDDAAPGRRRRAALIGSGAGAIPLRSSGRVGSRTAAPASGPKRGSTRRRGTQAAHGAAARRRRLLSGGDAGARRMRGACCQRTQPDGGQCKGARYDRSRAAGIALTGRYRRRHRTPAGRYQQEPASDRRRDVRPPGSSSAPQAPALSAVAACRAAHSPCRGCQGSCPPALLYRRHIRLC